MSAGRLKIAMLSVHSCPIGELGTKDTGGMSVYVRELARALGKRGHLVDIFTRFHDPNDSQIVELDENTRLIHLKAGPIADINKLAIYPHLTDFVCDLERFTNLENREYDLVHSHYWLSGWVGEQLQSLWDIPHLAMFHTLAAVKKAIGVGEEEPELRLSTEKELIQNCSRIIAATRREKDELIRYYDAPPNNIGVVPCGVNLDLFKPMDKMDARKQLGLNHLENIALFVGRIDPLKGIDRLLKANTYLQNNQGFKLIIIGGDSNLKPEWLRLKKLSHELGVQDSVLFIGRVKQEELSLYYSAADVFVVSSHHESFGLVALESLACGTPVIATKVGGIESIVQEGKTGNLVTGNIPRSFADKIASILSNQDTVMKSPKYIRASVIDYSWSNIAEAIIEQYRTTLKNRVDRAA
ncbi:MAG: glycosyltransferase [Deltaproteobacteria bacterium]|nr:glycosyltransferase [Deltaproteobacteria bacterium]MBW2141413.1 glycosyltransferase [Deltaproteobacteria bacterium]